MSSHNLLITKTFRNQGLLLRPAATARIKEYLDTQPGRSDDNCQRIVLLIKAKGLRSAAVELVDVEEALLSLATDNSDSKQTIFTYVDAFKLQRFEYEPVRKTMTRVPNGQLKLYGTADDKANMLRERWQLLRQRLARNPAFSPPAVSTASTEYHEVTHIEALIGRPGAKVIFGMLTQIIEGKWFIEDTNSVIEVVLTDAECTPGLFVESCMVLAHGELVGEKFFVTALGMPPFEPRIETLNAFPQLEYFGLEQGIDSKKERELRKQQMMEEHADDMIIVLSDVHLDNPRVMTQLHTLLTGYLPARPPLFVFCGNFTSRELGYGEDDAKTLEGLFDALCDLILQFPELVEESRFMFVPGPLDPVRGGHVLPAPPLPDVFTHKLREKLGDRVVMASNPARFLYGDQEVVLFRHDLLHHMRRNCVADISQNGATPFEGEGPPASEVFKYLAQTVIDQAHLCPLPLFKLPVYWCYDHALRLYPTPHALILADCVDQYHWIYEGTACLNPGSFACDSSFVVFWPGRTEKVEFSRIE